MKIFYSSQSASSSLRKGSALTIGNFDGVHHGHQMIFKTLLKEGKKRGLPPVLYTFNPHPVEILAPIIAPPLINTLEQKTELIKEQEIKIAIFEKFNLLFSYQTPEEFFSKIIVERLHARFIIIGHDFTFGRRREGNIETLELLCKKQSIDVTVIKPRMMGKTLISSTLVRKYVLKGSLTDANKLLGRPFFIDGVVVKGKQRGGLMGIHTANLKTENKLIPPDGVYATRVMVGKQTYKSVTNIGMNPTFGNSERSIETHILNFDRRIVGKKVRLSFINRIRDEIKFDSPRKLGEQIHRDIAVARKILK